MQLFKHKYFYPWIKLFVSVCIIPIISDAQTNYYPHHMGDIWVYYVRNGVRDDTLTVRIIKDSSDVEGSAFLQFSLSMRWPFSAPNDYWEEYQKIDNAGNLYFKIGQLYSRLQYKNGAQIGGKWWTGYDLDTAFVLRVTESTLFNETKTVRSIAHDVGTEGYGENYANDLGLISRTGSYAIVGELYLLSAKINGKQYGNPLLITGIERPINPVSMDIRLLQNYPNPFNGQTTIPYVMDARERIKISVYDLLGREVAVIFDDFQDQGSRSVAFQSFALPSGIYFYRLETKNIKTIKMMVLQK
jgi:hypothetical protein